MPTKATKPRVFADCDGWVYCGTFGTPECRESIGQVIENTLDGTQGEDVHVDFRLKDMTDEEVAALPEG